MFMDNTFWSWHGPGKLCCLARSAMKLVFASKIRTRSLIRGIQQDMDTLGRSPGSAALETQASEVLPSLRTAPGGRRPGREDHEAVPMPPENGWEETWIYRALSFELGEATEWGGCGGVCWGRMGEVS